VVGFIPSIGLDGDPHLAEMRGYPATMKHILAMDSIACQESALHGLGHWHYLDGGAVETIVDAFIDSHPGARPELFRYARAARCGCVL
jgi:hypothetical protein